MPREKTVYPTREIPHLWAHDPHGMRTDIRNAQSNLFTIGNTIYSYGEHFPIARHVHHNGVSCVFMTTRSYSNTTAKHINYVRQAIRHLTVLYVKNPESSPETVERQKRDAVAEAERLLRAETQKTQRCLAWERYDNIRCDYNLFVLTLKLGESIEQPADLSDIARVAIERRDRINAQTRKSRWHEPYPSDEDIEKWRRHEKDSLPMSAPCIFRQVGDEIESSKGARFPISHGKRLVNIIQQWIKTGHRQVWPYGTGPQIGVYRIDAISPENGIHAGCHHVKPDEIQRLIALVESAQAIEV